jgi:hypothetical protein
MIYILLLFSLLIFENLKSSEICPGQAISPQVYMEILNRFKEEEKLSDGLKKDLIAIELICYMQFACRFNAVQSELHETVQSKVSSEVYKILQQDLQVIALPFIKDFELHKRAYCELDRNICETFVEQKCLQVMGNNNWPKLYEKLEAFQAKCFMEMILGSSETSEFLA